MRIGVEGYVTLEVFKADGTFTGKRAHFHNLITNIGKDALATQADVMVWCHVGTGSTTPAITDTWLSAWLASSSDKKTDVNGIVSTTYGYRRVKIRFGIGTATGNLSEAGVGWSDTTGTAFMHELIRDGAGDPTTITVLSDEYLEFTYELRYNIPAGDFTGSGTVDGETYNYVMRAASCTTTARWSASIGKKIDVNTGDNLHFAYTGSLGTIDSVPSGISGNDTRTMTVNTYNTGDYYREFTLSADTTQWNVSGGEIFALTLTPTATRWQCSFSKASDSSGVPKTNTYSRTMTFRVSWDRA